MILYLVRHGIATDRTDPQSPPDSERPLTAKGVQKSRQAALGLAETGAKPDVILTSPYVRAAQTAEIFAEALGVAQEKIRACEGLKPTGNPADVVKEAALLQADGVASIAIMSNDTKSHPDDSFDNMKKFAAQHGFGFPYVIDTTQDVARAYAAVCTPDFFGFDKDLKLRYRGRIYEMAPGLKTKPGSRHELLEGMRQVAKTGQAPADQTPSIGCSIKWRR